MGKKKINTFRNPEFLHTLTVPEVVHYFDKHRNTVMMQIYTGGLEARQTVVGNTWLVSTVSALALWPLPDGNPLAAQWDDEGYMSDD